MDEKELNAKFKQDTRSRGVEHALDEVHKFNDAAAAREQRQRDNDMDGMASNTLAGLGLRMVKPSRSAGRRTVTSTASKDGIRGILRQVYFDGALQSEHFEPI